MILAKSDGTSLQKHVKDLLVIFNELREAIPCLSNKIGDEFWKWLFLACCFHDIGKSHVEFQKQLRGLPNNWNHQRHELYSIPFVQKLDLPDEEVLLIQRVILAHHKYFDELKRMYRQPEELERERAHCYPQSFHPEDFHANLKRSKVMPVQYIIEMLNKLLNSGVEYHVDVPQLNKKFDIENLQHPYNGIARKPFDYTIDNNEYWNNILLWGALKICDHYGSGGFTSILIFKPEHFYFLDRLERKLREANLTFYQHQQKCFKKLGNNLLVAPTGSGKTEASMGWLRTQLTKCQGRAFYVLPYTASINAMHQRLMNQIDDQELFVGIQHGKISSYIDRYFEDSFQVKKEIKDAMRRIFSPLKIITPFQILKYFFGVKGFEKGFVELIGSNVIFDEIHAYDPRTFAQILVMIEYLIIQFNSRIMVMTATLPTFMLKELKAVMNIHEEIRADASLLQSLKRHNVTIAEGGIKDKIGLIYDYVKNEKRVIVVCNTVKQAQEIYRLIQNELKIDHKDVTLLHSRFNAKDRLVKEERCYDPGTKILVGTQAIEVSLDIDYDVMVTEPAPLDALLQRFGRVNRKCQKSPASVIICKKGGEYDSFIYRSSVVDRTLHVLDNVVLLSEEKIQEYLDYVYPKWEEDDEVVFLTTKKYFLESLSSLQPYQSHKENEEEFYQQFNGISVLPACFYDDYEQLISESNFIEAENLFVSIHNSMFMKFIKSGLISKMENKYGNVFVCSSPYSSELGLYEKENDNALYL